MVESHSPELTFTHTRLLVTDYQECFHFYRDILGFDVGWGDAEGGYADFQTGETTLALFDRTAMAEAVGTEQVAVEAEHQDEVSLILRVESVDETYERLKTEVPFITEPHDQPDWGIRVAHFRDPDGTLLEINESLEER